MICADLAGYVAQCPGQLIDIKPPFGNLENPGLHYLPHPCNVALDGLAGVVVRRLLQLVDKVRGPNGVRPQFLPLLTPSQPRNESVSLAALQ